MHKKSVLSVVILFMLFSFLPAVATATDMQEAPAIEVVKTVSFRTSPSTDASRIRYLQTGERLLIVSEPNRYWFQAKDASGITGYVSSSTTYVKKITITGLAEPNGQVIASVSFRTGPSTDSARIRYLRPGEFITIVEQTNAYWYKAADASHTIGYVSTNTKYIDTMFNQMQEQEEPVYIEEPNAIIAKSVSFRTEPSVSADRIRYLQAGEPLWILDKPNRYWYKAKDKRSVIGYVSTGSGYVTTDYIETWKTLDPSAAAEMAIQAGLKYLGTPYEFGSSRLDTSTFDCSDFVRQAYLDGIGLRLPGDSASQGAFILEQHDGNVITDWHSLKQGDLMFFMAYKGYEAANYEDIDKSKEKITHVGIYLGDGQILHTYSAASGGVKISEIAGTQWERRYLYGGSVYK